MTSITPSFIQLMDQSRPPLEPFAAHYLHGKSAVLKNAYVTILCALLLDAGPISEPQNRLLGLLLPAMQLEYTQAHYMQEAQRLDQRQLTGHLALLRKDNDVAQSLLFDAMVLLRIACSLSEYSIASLSRLMQLLYLSKYEGDLILFWVLKLLDDIPSAEYKHLGRAQRITFYSETSSYDSKKECNVNRVLKDPFMLALAVPAYMLVDVSNCVSDVCVEKGVGFYTLWPRARIDGYFYYQKLSVCECDCAGVVAEVHVNEKVSTDWWTNTDAQVCSIIPFPDFLCAWYEFYGFEQLAKTKSATHQAVERA